MRIMPVALTFMEQLLRVCFAFGPAIGEWLLDFQRPFRKHQQFVGIEPEHLKKKEKRQPYSWSLLVIRLTSHHQFPPSAAESL